MSKRWPESVRTSGRLLIWAGVTGSAGWKVPLERALKEFNRALDARKLGLKVALTQKESDAQLTFGIGRKDQFARSTHGNTALSAYEDGTLVRADILVHPSPQVRAFRKKPASKEYEEYSREAGEGIRVCIIVHELIHACGLVEHSKNESPDVFYSPLEPNSGDAPAGDYMRVPVVQGIKLPPIVISAQTARRLRDAWSS